jgi:hypothetical protein
MAKDSRPLVDLNTQAKLAVEETKLATDRMKQSVEETKEQALGAANTYFDFLIKTISSFPSGGTEFGEKLKSFAEKSIAATHDFIKQLSRAKDFQDALRIQTEFMRTQMRAFGEQTKSLAEAFIKTATSEVRVPFKTSLK